MGAAPLWGMPFEIPDLRAGFAYILAALIATGTSEISGTRYLERGYEDPIGKLQSIGAKIETVPIDGVGADAADSGDDIGVGEVSEKDR
jgi:UDP-N-acetylglucosamine 1-carboxyvinyltransferase